MQSFGSGLFHLAKKAFEIPPRYYIKSHNLNLNIYVLCQHSLDCCSSETLEYLF